MSYLQDDWLEWLATTKLVTNLITSKCHGDQSGKDRSRQNGLDVFRAMYERSINYRQAWQEDEDVAQGAT